MGRISEETLAGWTGPASDAEQDRYDWTRDAIRDALRSATLNRYSFDVYAKGSYPNFTNVVRDSDVDIAVELTEFINNDFDYDAEGLSVADIGLTPYAGGYTLASFKDDVEAALVEKFGRGAIDRGKKAIHVRQSGQGLAADVVPCVTHRTHHSRTTYFEGTKLRNDANPVQHIVNYPKQHLKCGTAKNDNTSRRYKRVVRILKRVENDLVKKGIIEVVPSFLIESAVWNVPNLDFLTQPTWSGRVQNALAHIHQGTKSDACTNSDEWLEANGIKFLFHPAQGWTYQQANQFAYAAYHYLGLGE